MQHQKNQFVPYRQREHKLSVQNDCLLWGSRVVVPKSGREAVLTMLHDAHPGGTRMKAFVWWPGIDSDLEAKVKACHACQVNQKVRNHATQIGFLIRVHINVHLAVKELNSVVFLLKRWKSGDYGTLL